MEVREKAHTLAASLRGAARVLEQESNKDDVHGGPDSNACFEAVMNVKDDVDSFIKQYLEEQ